MGGEQRNHAPRHETGPSTVVKNVKAWRNAVQRLVTLNHEKLRYISYMNIAYLTDDKDLSGSEAITRRFDRRVEEILATHDGPVLRLIFDRSNALGASTVSGEPRYDEALGKACEAAGYTGHITVDYTQLDPHATPKGNPMALPEALGEIAMKNPGKRIFIIIDGFGERAVKDWGASESIIYAAMAPFGREPRTVIMRVSRQQKNARPPDAWESAWTGKFAFSDPSTASGEYSGDPLYGRAFSEEHFEGFVRALSQAVEQVEAGDRSVCFQAPNNWGKTTMLHALATLPEDQGLPQHIEVAEVSILGEKITSLRDGSPLTLDVLKARGVTTLIVDEAGRADSPDSDLTALDALQIMEQTGIKIVYVFPGNVNVSHLYKRIIDPSKTT